MKDKGKDKVVLETLSNFVENTIKRFKIKQNNTLSTEVSLKIHADIAIKILTTNNKEPT